MYILQTVPKFRFNWLCYFHQRGSCTVPAISGQFKRKDNKGTIHLRRWQIFMIFYPYPPPVGSFFTTIRQQIGTIFDPSPLEYADVLNGWSPSQKYQNFGTIIQRLSTSEDLWPRCAAWRRTSALKLQSNSANKNWPN